MARSWQYPRWRRIALQGVMCLILAGTVGLAALVVHRRNSALAIQLGKETTFGNLTLHLPADWEVASGTDEDPLVVVRAREPSTPSDSAEGAADLARSLTVYRQRTADFISPLQYLDTSGLLSLPSPRASGENVSFKAEPLRVGGWPGALIEYTNTPPAAPSPAPDAEIKQHKEFFACTVLPSHQAITLRLEGFGPPDQQDFKLIQKLAENLSFTDDPAPLSPDGSPAASAGPDLLLPDGTRITIPDGFITLPASDSNRTDRQLLRPDPWTSLDLIPCVFFPNDAPQGISSLLTARNLLWHRADVRNEGTYPSSGPLHLRMDPVDPADLFFPVRAYLLANADGHALLGVFRAGPRPNAPVDARHPHSNTADTELFDAAWQAIAANVHFADTPNPADLLRAGTEETARLRATGLENLLSGAESSPTDAATRPIAETGLEQWWLWYHETPDHYVGWSHFTLGHAGTWTGNTDMRWRNADRSLSRVEQLCQGSNDLSTYTQRMNRAEAGREPDQSFVQTLHVELAARYDRAAHRGRLDITRAAGPNAVPLSRALPEQFVPGGWLPLLLPALSPKPMILRTDSFPGYEGAAPTEPLTLLITPDPNAGSQAVAPADRVITVQVNGSGELTRWTFTPAGTLESIDFPDHLRRVPSDADAIRLAFRLEPRLLW